MALGSTIITLEDWYHVPSLQVRGVPTPDSTLINGHGRSKDGPKMPLSVINVEHGKRYRIRLVSMVCDPNYRFSIDSHTMFIIEADADYTQMVEVDSLQIFAGGFTNLAVGFVVLIMTQDNGTPSFCMQRKT